MHTVADVSFLFSDILDTAGDTMVYFYCKGDSMMSSWDKLLQRILTLSNDLRFDELRKVLETYGYEMKAPHGGSSHATFRKPDCAPITVPRHEPIKKAYVLLVRDVVESEASNNENH